MFPLFEAKARAKAFRLERGHDEMYANSAPPVLDGEEEELDSEDE